MLYYYCYNLRRANRRLFMMILLIIITPSLLYIRPHRRKHNDIIT